MAKITIDRERCKGCLLCISFCPKGLISVDKNLNRRGVKPAKFSPAFGGGSPAKGGKAGNESPECLGCTMCAIICPDCCIEVFR